MAELSPDSWFKDQFEKAWEEQAARVGRFNLAIFGKTGVGKSTLVNAIFGEAIAETGIGTPVTQKEHLYLHQSGFLGVLDTRGLEVGVDNAQILAELGEYLAKMRRAPLSEQLHVAWYCVRAGDRRFEDTEAEFVTELVRLGLPVIVVMTQVAKSDEQFHPDAEALAAEIKARDLPVAERRVFMTMALADPFTKQPAHGLHDLLDATFRTAPAGVENAINTAQKIDQKRKRAEATKAIDTATAAAFAAGATPIPFADAVVLVPIQIRMMAQVSTTYDIPMERATIASLAATAAATAAGRSAVTSLIKFVPGFGMVAGGAISAAVASTFTKAMGQAWLLLCERMSTGQLGATGDMMDNETIRRVFLDEFKAQVRKRKPGKEIGAS